MLQPVFELTMQFPKSTEETPVPVPTTRLELPCLPSGYEQAALALTAQVFLLPLADVEIEAIEGGYIGRPRDSEVMLEVVCDSREDGQRIVYTEFTL